MVILPDHFHALWTLPPNDADYSIRMGLLKRYVSQRVRHRIEEPRTLPQSGSGASLGFGNVGFGSIRSATTPIMRVMQTTRITTRSSMGLSAAYVSGRIRRSIVLCVWVCTRMTGPVVISRKSLVNMGNDPRAHSAPYICSSLDASAHGFLALLPH